MSDAANTYDALAPKHQAFVTAYCMCWNAAAAARAAGYASRRSRNTGYELLQRPDVQAAVDAWRKQNGLDVLGARLTGLLHARMDDYFCIGADGQPTLDLDKLARNRVSLVSELTVENRRGGVSAPGGAVDPANGVVKTRFRLSETFGAAKPARDGHSGKGDDPAPAKPVSHRDRAKAVLALLAKAKAEREAQ